MYYSKIRNRRASLRWLKNMKYWNSNFSIYVASRNIAKKYIAELKIK